MATGYLWNELYGWNDTGSGSLGPSDVTRGLQPVSHHFAHADHKRRMHELIVVSGLAEHLVRVPARHATREQIVRVHTQEHHDRIVAESEWPKGGDAGDGNSPFGKGGYGIAALAAGGALAMVEAVVRGEVENGYALVNPCGHHATPETGMGFCVFNNVAIAVRHAQDVLGVERIAVVDWDVHHGNGTQSVFWEDPNVLTVSVHQDRLYPPDQGHVTERGGGLGTNANLNLPLPPGTGDAGYLYAMETVVLPAVRAFGPDLIVVACGFDPSFYDPLAHQMLSAQGFGTMTRMVRELARDLCEGRLAMVQEGGYSIHYVAICGATTVAALAGLEPIVDPLAPGARELEPHQKAVCDELALLLPEMPRSASDR